MRFKDKVVVVTGGSRGIGKSIAESFNDEGATVIVTYKNAIDENYFDSKNIKHHKCDVADAKAVGELVDALVKEFGKIDVLVNNAGITKDGLLMRMSEDDWNNKVPQGIREIFHLCVQLKGTISGEHGIGYVQKGYMDIAFNQAQIDLQKGIKKLFDPNNILNPDKMFV